jgi:hypothetical protein
MPDWLQTTLWIVGGVAVVFVVVGLMLPRDFKVARSIVIAAPPERIHPYVDSFEKWPLWSPFDTEDPTIVWENSTQLSGVGAKRSWKSKKMGDGSQWITRSDPRTGVAMKLAITAGGFDPFDIDFAYAAESGGTRVTWTDSGRIPSGPHWRWMGVLVMPRVCGNAFDRGLAALKREVEKTA